MIARAVHPAHRTRRIVAELSCLALLIYRALLPICRSQSGADPAALLTALAGGASASSSIESGASKGQMSKSDESSGQSERPLMRTQPTSISQSTRGGASACDAPAGSEAAAVKGACETATSRARKRTCYTGGASRGW